VFLHRLFDSRKKMLHMVFQKKSPRSRPWYAVRWYRQEWRPLPIRSLFRDRITPPFDLNATFWELERKENDHDRNNSPTIQRRTQHIIKLAPPSEILLPNQILEDKRNEEPRTIVDARSRWDCRKTSKDNRCADVASP